MQRINPRAAGIDCGSTAHYVAVDPDLDPKPVRRFSTFTEGLKELADWLVSCGVTTVAMEATGVYWIPIYDILEERGLEVLLVNARHVKNVPGRNKTDVSDAEWLQQLHSVGLFRGSFRPAAEIVALRTYIRHRETLVREAATTVNRMQKAMVQMNLHLHVVISDVQGVTGLRILRDIVAGKHEATQLAKHRDARCKASEAEIVAALTGNYRPEQLFALGQNLELYDAYQQQITKCDTAIEAQVKSLVARSAEANPRPPELPTSRRRTKPRGNEPKFDIRADLHHLTGGVDLSQIHGIGPYNALRLLSEIGTDMSRWPTEHHFTSWLTLAPTNKISGGRLLSSGTTPSANRAAAILRMAALSLARTQTQLGAFYRRLSSRIGKAKAITATARKLAIVLYRCLKGEIAYQDPGAEAYEQRRRELSLRTIRQRAADLGYALVECKSGEILDPPSGPVQQPA